MPRIIPDEAENYQGSLNGEWFSLKNDKDVARVQFMIDKYDDLDVFACHKVEVGGKERYVDCLRTYDDPIDNCPLCAAGIPVKPVRFVVMYQHDDGKVKIWERGKNFVDKLKSLCNRYSPLSEYVFEIERVGVAGSKDTKYEIYPMDRVEPVDLAEVERPELLGGLILDKTADEMDIYLDTGEFPQIEKDTQRESRPKRETSHQATRRVPAGGAATQAAPTSRGGVTRREAPATTAPNPAPRGPARGGRRTAENNEEVF